MKIKKNIHNMISFLSHSYAITIGMQDTNNPSRSVTNPLCTKEDLQQDLYVFYLEKKKLKKIKSDGGWFIAFKNHLNNKFKHIVVGRKVLEKYTSEYKIST